MKASRKILATAGAAVVGLGAAIVAATPAHATVSCNTVTPIAYYAVGECYANFGETGRFRIVVSCYVPNTPVTTTVTGPWYALNVPGRANCPSTSYRASGGHYDLQYST